MDAHSLTARLLAASVVLIYGCNGTGTNDVSAANTAPAQTVASESAARASCGDGSLVETALQGQVPLADRKNGRNLLGYRCNLERVGQYQGEGASWVNPSIDHCAYMATSFSGIPSKKSQGVQVIDVSDISNPVLSTHLTSPAFLQGPWESMKISASRGLIAGSAVGPISGVGFVDVYDISKDCAKPVLLNSFSGNLTLPGNLLGHEGNWSPDGKTYWANGGAPGMITAIDMSTPSNPKILYTGLATPTNHGLEFSPDGNRMYLSTINPTGLSIIDTSSIQNRAAVPMLTQLGSVTWNINGNSQQSSYVTYQGKPYVLAIDEASAGAARFIDVSDDKNPKVVSFVKLEIHLDKQADVRKADTANNGLFGYEGHYCSFDRKVDPTALACSFFQSGVRVFDVRNPLVPKEIAYYNPPPQAGKAAQLPGSEHTAPVTGQGADLSTDWCSSPPRFVGADQLWVTCQDNGFMVLKFTNRVYPLSP